VNIDGGHVKNNQIKFKLNLIKDQAN